MTETRIVNDQTGGVKASKPEKYHQLPWPALRELARVYGFGSEKYERYNYMKGYDWSLSYDSLIRHAEQFWSGEDNDTESSLSHMAHAAFHCLALVYFQENHPNLDDRPNTKLATVEEGLAVKLGRAIYLNQKVSVYKHEDDGYVRCVLDYSGAAYVAKLEDVDLI